MRRRTFFRSAAAAAAAISIPRHALQASVFAPARVGAQELNAITGDGKAVTISASEVENLRKALRGRLLLAGNDGYEDARRILNPSFDKRPALIVQPTGVADIRTAVDFARAHDGLLTAVKCGGHSLSGQSTCDRGLQIDLSLFRAVRVDPQAKRAWVTGGSLLGSVDHEAMAHGLVTPLGTVSHTGVGGLVTGGGFGRVARKFGLSVDNLVAVDVVTADGQLRRASKSENADLFWGVRGGGGNFGIVTNFEFILHPMSRQVIAGQIGFPITVARDALKLYSELLARAPDELYVSMNMGKPPGDAPGSVGFEIVYVGDAAAAQRAIAPILRLGTPVRNTVASTDYVALQRSGDTVDPRAMSSYTKSGFIASMPDELIHAIVDGFKPDPRRLTAVFFQPSGGAIARVSADAMAFSQRDVQANMLSAVGWRFGDDGSQHIDWIKGFWPALEKHTYGFYVNDLEAETNAASVKANYRSNHDRLVAVKNKYDPKNLFRLNANVKPTV